MSLDVLHRDDLQLGGFAGLKEYRLVMGFKAFGHHTNPDSWPGIGNFVYLADAVFNPHGETTLHDHKEVDVISIMVDGHIQHEGSLEHGQNLEAGDVQVQRAGGEGFSHNEINPDETVNRMLQLWVLPEQRGQAAIYKLYKPLGGNVTRIYGGSDEQTDTLSSQTVIEYVSLNASKSYTLDKAFMAYLVIGTGTANEAEVREGDLFKDTQLTFTAISSVTLLVIYKI